MINSFYYISGDAYMSEKTQQKTRKVTSRAFTIKNPLMTSSQTPYYLKIYDKFNATVAKDRCMMLSALDDNTDEDLLANCEIHNNETNIFGTLFRLSHTGDVSGVSDKILSEKCFSYDDLTYIKANCPAVYKMHYYFCMDGSNFITNLPQNRTISMIQTYINYFLDTSDFEITPKIIPVSKTQLCDLKSIKFQDPRGNGNIDEISRRSYNLKDTAFAFIKDLFSDTTSLTEEELKRVISAVLTIKLKKPKKMTDEEYQANYGAIMKPISDVDNVSLIDRKGNKISGTDILRKKIVEIDLTETGMLVEPQLQQEMKKFLDEL